WARSNAVLSATYLPLVMVLSSIGVALALVGGGWSVMDGAISIGTLVAFMQFAALFFMPVEELARRFGDIQSAQSWAERLQTLMDAEVTIRDSESVRAVIARHAASGSADPALAEDGLPRRIGRIDFRNVGFSYGAGPKVLDDVSLAIEPGQTVALVGPTGGGKSTIVSLLCRFYEPTTGAVLIDGVEYRERSLHWLQSSLGIVQQVPHLFAGTILENIRYGRLAASDEEVEKAARTVNAHAFVVALEHGYETQVGEGGSRLSTGQRQLVALARAVLADPAIFILDEATSSVDTETERLIQAGVERILAGRISLVIAHRLSTIRSADQILVVDGGRIVERGNHDTLMRRRGRYHELYLHHVQAQAERSLLGRT
ncbi:MAG: ABC transporter ATP-binding protein, partial [Phycisphaerales bacterium]|nr:ABC transporter ATP-binding protein [Phycisphaerales bacterium]